MLLVALLYMGYKYYRVNYHLRKDAKELKLSFLQKTLFSSFVPSSHIGKTPVLISEDIGDITRPQSSDLQVLRNELEQRAHAQTVMKSPDDKSMVLSPLQKLQMERSQTIKKTEGHASAVSEAAGGINVTLMSSMTQLRQSTFKNS